MDKYKSNARKILEIACGTGNILQSIKDNYEVEGLDISESMLAMARAKMPKINFYHQDMANFPINTRYGVIYCFYDSINHVLDLSGWEGTFKSVSSHLESSGIFIFDMHTLNKLDQMTKRPPYFVEFDNNYLIMQVRKETEYSNIYLWDIKIFERITENGLYQLNQEIIKETSFYFTNKNFRVNQLKNI
ncbi:MAG: class I SAM-dependent methyltransferase [Candidatus Dojkabacteria bacterium]|nr:class I SAM-dependent methyltransferase [Candidatus Dojkabacteria bacterium]